MDNKQLEQVQHEETKMDFVTSRSVVVGMILMGMLSACQGDYTEEQKAQIAKKCLASGQEAEIHSSWSVCRSPNQISDQ